MVGADERGKSGQKDPQRLIKETVLLNFKFRKLV